MGDDVPGMCWSGSWEQCVREVTLSADPDTVGSLSSSWHTLSTALMHLRDALVGRVFVGPVATGTHRPQVDGLSTLLDSWKGAGADAYREHLGKLGTQIEDLSTLAANVSGALSRIDCDIRKAVASIPIPVLDDGGWDEWSLPNNTNLDSADDGADSQSFLRLLRADYQANPSSYDDGAFRDKADDLEATLKLDGSNDGTKRGGLWDTDSHLDNWYRDNTAAANAGARPLPTGVEAERPKLVVPPPKSTGHVDRTREDPGGLPGATGPGTPSAGGMPGSATPPMGGGSFGDTGAYTPPVGTGYGSYSPSAEDYGTSLAGAGDGPGFRPPSGTGGFGAGSPGGLGSAGGANAAGGFGAGALPGVVGGGNGKMPPMTSAKTALRGAMANAGPAGRGAGAGAGGGMMGGGGGHGGHGGGGEEHTSWLTEDDDPWGVNDGVPPGILR